MFGPSTTSERSSSSPPVMAVTSVSCRPANFRNAIGPPVPTRASPLHGRRMALPSLCSAVQPRRSCGRANRPCRCPDRFRTGCRWRGGTVYRFWARLDRQQQAAGKHGGSIERSAPALAPERAGQEIHATEQRCQPVCWRERDRRSRRLRDSPHTSLVQHHDQRGCREHVGRDGAITEIKGALGFGVRWIGNDLAYVSSSSGGFALSKWRSLTKTKEILAPSGGNFSVSRDGSTIVYFDYDRREFWKIAPEGRSRFLLPGSSLDSQLQPDGRQLLSVDGGSGRRRRSCWCPLTVVEASAR